MALNLSGYRGSTSGWEDTYSFSVSVRAGHDPGISEWMFMDPSNSLPVALVKANRPEVRARFISPRMPPDGTDFRFTNGSCFFIIHDVPNGSPRQEQPSDQFGPAYGPPQHRR